jgi:hypothetical protein
MAASLVATATFSTAGSQFLGLAIEYVLAIELSNSNLASDGVEWSTKALLTGRVVRGLIGMDMEA